MSQNAPNDLGNDLEREVKTDLGRAEADPSVNFLLMSGGLAILAGLVLVFIFLR